MLRLQLPRLPAACPFCAAWPCRGPGGICAHCVELARARGPRCGRCALALPAIPGVCPACALQPSPLQTCLVAVDYAYPWDTAIAAFKYRQEPSWAAAMAQLIRQVDGAPALLARADWIVPVPMTARRMRARGYNQAWELARALARQSGHGHKARTTLLGVARQAPGRHAAQVGSGRQSRLARLGNAFECHPGDGAGLQGRHVLVVDDVVTTGATLFAAARALLQAGACSVEALAFARTALPGPPGKPAVTG